MKKKKEAEKLIKSWDDEGIRLEKARWGRFNLIKGKIKIELPKDTKVDKLAIEDADRIELTRVHTSIEGDAFFPEINYNLWEEVSSENRFKDDKNEYDYTFYRYDKKN